MGGGVFLRRAPYGRTRGQIYCRDFRLPAVNPATSDNFGNAITLGVAVGYQVTEVTGFVTFRQRRNIDRVPVS